MDFPDRTTRDAVVEIAQILATAYQRHPRAAQVLALALQFQEMIDGGEVRDDADLARLGCVSRERFSQIMMLVWLAPDIQEEALRLPPNAGHALFSEGALRRIAKMVRWEKQRRA